MNQRPTLISLMLLLGGLILSVGSPLVATLSFFPLWISKGGEVVVSGFALLLILISALPFYRLIKKGIASPSGITIWLLLFLLFFSMSKIADQMTIISFVGLIGNLLGGILFKIRNKIKEDRSNEP